MRKELLYLNWITKSYHDNIILKYVNLNVFENEIFAIVGRNAVGKSTLLKLIGGYIAPDRGTIYLHEKKISLKNHFDALALGIYSIHSSIEIIPEMSVFENVYLGLIENRNSGFLFNKKRAYQKIAHTAQHLMLPISLDKSGRFLTALEKYYVEILRAVLNRSSLLLIDEPFMTLNNTETNLLKKLLIKLKSQGLSIIFTSHKVIDLYELADRICILKSGKTSVIFENNYTYIDLQNKLIDLLSGCQSASKLPAEAKAGEEELRIESFCVPPYIQDLSFVLHQHEILGITGLNSLALNNLMDSLWGLTPHTKGNIFLKGKPILINNPRQALKNKIAYMSDVDSNYPQIIQNLSILNNLTLPFLERIFPHPIIHPRMENYLAVQNSQFIPFQKNQWKNKAQNLSYGMEKMLALARWFSMKHNILILNEPLKGLDLDSRSKIILHLRKLAANGTPIIMKSMDFDDVAECATRAIVIENGKIQGEVKGTNITTDKLLSLSLKNNREEFYV